MHFIQQLIFFIVSSQVCLKAVFAQQAATGARPEVNPLALGGMIQGLLDMQIRPEGGFYEDKYKKIFVEDSKTPLPPIPTPLVGRRQTNELDYKGIISQDGKLLQDSTAGRSPNPCFELERIQRNRLLSLICTLRLQNAWNK